VNSGDRPAFVLDTPKGQAEVLLTDGQNVTLRASFPTPPGSPLSGVLRGTRHALRVKIHGCRRITPSIAADSDEGLDDRAQAQAWFEISGRWVNLSREARFILLGETDLT
jgi:hypothetical protein